MKTRILSSFCYSLLAQVAIAGLCVSRISTSDLATTNAAASTVDTSSIDSTDSIIVSTATNTFAEETSTPITQTTTADISSTETSGTIETSASTTEPSTTPASTTESFTISDSTAESFTTPISTTEATAATTTTDAPPTFTKFTAYDENNTPHDSWLGIEEDGDVVVVLTWNTGYTPSPGALTIYPDTNRVSVVLDGDDRVWWAVIRRDISGGSGNLSFMTTQMIGQLGNRDYVNCIRGGDGFLTCGVENGQSVTLGRWITSKTVDLVKDPFLSAFYGPLRLLAE